MMWPKSWIRPPIFNFLYRFKMLVKFQDLPDTARIWIYSSSRNFTDHELGKIEAEVSQFLSQWTAHGAGLKAGFTLPYRRFIVLGIDDTHTGASGCSIDASVRFIKSLEQKYQLELLNNSLITFKEGNDIKNLPFTEFKVQAAAGLLNENTIVFDNTVSDKYNFLLRWICPAKDSWLQQFFETKEV